MSAPTCRSILLLAMQVVRVPVSGTEAWRVVTSWLLTITG